MLASSETRDAVKHGVMHRTAPQIKNYPAPNANSAKGEKPWTRGEENNLST